MKQILIIEDDSDQALLTSETLEDALEEVSIQIAPTGEEALVKDLSVFDVIILDYNLPDMTGLEILDEMAHREHGPVMMVTGEEVLEIAVESLKRGAEEFIIKSVDFHQLLPHVVERTIAAFQQRKKVEEMEIREREKKIQMDTLKRVMMTLAHHLNNAVMPIIFSAELCQRSDYSRDLACRLVNSCIKETQRINKIIEQFEKYIEEEEFKYTDYLDWKDAMFDVENASLTNK